MLISHRYRFVFIKPPKTAGSSIESALRGYCLPLGAAFDAGHVFPETVSEAGLVTESGNQSPSTSKFKPHSSAAQIRKLLGSQLFDEYLKISVSRNPYDRAISLFWWDLKLKEPALYRRIRSNPSDVRNQFARWCRDRQSFIRWASLSKFASPRELGPRSFIIRFESIEDDYKRLLERLQVDEPYCSTLPHHKGTVRFKPLTTEGHYSLKSRMAIAYAWRQDFFAHGYSLGLPLD
jgi:hypothetical protein